MKKKILILFFCLLLLPSCGNVELKKGENAVVLFNENEGISVNELYKVLKDKYGINNLVDMIDSYLLEKEFDSTNEEVNYTNNVISAIKEDTKTNGIDFNTYILNNYGAKTENEFKEYIILNYRRNAWIEQYVKENVTEKQIEDYYENYTIGDIEASHILIAPKVTDGMTDKEKENAENEAYNTAKEIIKKLNNKEDFATLAKEYSDDGGTANKGGSLGYFNRGDMDRNFEEEAIKLEVGKYSTKPVKTTYGYHIILKTNQKDKPSLKDAKSNIINTIAKETLETNQNIYVTAIIALREKYNMKIKDSKLKKDYNDLMGKLIQ